MRAGARISCDFEPSPPKVPNPETSGALYNVKMKCCTREHTCQYPELSRVNMAVKTECVVSKLHAIAALKNAFKTFN